MSLALNDQSLGGVKLPTNKYKGTLSVALAPLTQQHVSTKDKWAAQHNG